MPGGTADEGAGSSGIAGAIGSVVPGAGAAPAGGFTNVSSRIERGARERVDMIWRMNASVRNKPPHHHEAFVSNVPACRIPMNASGDELAPPKLAASPLPLPACSSIDATSTTATITRITRRKL